MDSTLPFRSRKKTAEAMFESAASWAPYQGRGVLIRELWLEEFEKVQVIGIMTGDLGYASFGEKYTLS